MPSTIAAARRTAQLAIQVVDEARVGVTVGGEASIGTFSEPEAMLGLALPRGCPIDASGRTGTSSVRGIGVGVGDGI